MLYQSNQETNDRQAYVKDTPYLALGIAAGLGYIAAGVFVKKKTSMDRLLDTVSDEVRSLKKEDKSPEGYLLQEVEKFKEQLKKPHFGNIIKRFGAWLYIMQQEPLPAIRLWLASSRPVAEQILQRYKSAAGREAVPVFKLVLPATLSASGKYVVEQIEAFRQATTLIHRGLVADFTRITSTVPYMPDSADSLLPYGTDWADQWETLIYDAFPAAQNGRTNITFYLLPDKPVASLFVPERPRYQWRSRQEWMLLLLIPRLSDPHLSEKWCQHQEN